MYSIMTAGATIGEAAGLYIALERACQMQLLVEAAAANGVEKKFIGREECEFSKKYDYTSEGAFMSFIPEYEAILAETKGAFLL